MSGRGLLVLALVSMTVIVSLILRGRLDGARPVEAQASPALEVRAIVQFVSRDVLADLVIEDVAITETQPFGATFTYRIRNIGDDSADLSRFTLQAWFSTDGSLEKDRDAQAGLVGFTQVLVPLGALELSMTAANGDADVVRYPYLILELNSAGAVREASTANNMRAVLRPPLDLVSRVELSWDAALNRATVTWEFSGTGHGIPDLGFRIDAQGFGVQEVPPGTRSIMIRFNPVTGERPCIARVTAIREGNGSWPPVLSNRLCQ